MLNRRRFLGYSTLAPALLAERWLPSSAAGRPTEPAFSKTPLRLAIIGNTYHYRWICKPSPTVSLVGYPYEGYRRLPNVQVVSLYLNRSHASGMSRLGANGRRRIGGPRRPLL